MGILFIIKRTKLSKITKIISRSCNHLERAKRIWNSRRLLERALALLERRIAATHVRVCDGNAMRVRWACDAFELRVQNYCKNLDKKKVKCTKTEKNAINSVKIQRSCIFTIIPRWHICQNVTNVTNVTHFWVSGTCAHI